MKKIAQIFWCHSILAFSDLYVNNSILHMIRRSTGNQCKSTSTSVMCSYYLKYSLIIHEENSKEMNV